MFSNNTNHPIIVPGNDYVLGRKNISIHSDDRDISKWPRENHFAVKLPEPITNVQSIQLIDVSFPVNLPVFTRYGQNTKIWIEVKPTLFDDCDSDVPISHEDAPIRTSQYFNDYIKIGKYLNKYIPNETPGKEPIEIPSMPCIWSDTYQLSALHEIKISEGTYSGDELACELQFKINKHFECFFKDSNIFGSSAVKLYKYDRFRVVYDKIEKRFKFGNTADAFKLYFDRPNEYKFNTNPCIISCEPKVIYPHKTRWGLGWNLGFCKGMHDSTEFEKTSEDCTSEIYLGWSQQKSNDKSPSHTYSPWVNVLPGFKKAYYLFGTTCCNLTGSDIIYMEIDCYNSSDELIPFPSCTSSSINSVNSYGGKVNSYFAKIPIIAMNDGVFNPGLNYNHSIISTNPFNGKQFLYKPEEIIEKLKITFRYHNGNLVDFCNHPINFSLNFGFLKPDEIHNQHNKIRFVNF